MYANIFYLCHFHITNDHNFYIYKNSWVILLDFFGSCLYFFGGWGRERGCFCLWQEVQLLAMLSLHVQWPSVGGTEVPGAGRTVRLFSHARLPSWGEDWTSPPEWEDNWDRATAADLQLQTWNVAQEIRICCRPLRFSVSFCIEAD